MIEVKRAFRYVTPLGHVQRQAAGVFDSLPEHVRVAAEEAGVLKMRRAPSNKAKRAPRNK